MKKFKLGDNGYVKFQNGIRVTVKENRENRVDDRLMNLRERWIRIARDGKKNRKGLDVFVIVFNNFYLIKLSDV